MNEKIDIENDFEEEKIENQKQSEFMQEELKKQMLDILNSEKRKSTKEIESLNIFIENLNNKHQAEIKEVIDIEKRKSLAEIDNLK